MAPSRGQKGKDPDAGKDWRREKGTAEDEMVGWHHRLHGHEFEQALGVGDGQGGLACRSPWGHKESDKTQWLNNNTAHRAESCRSNRQRQTQQRNSLLKSPAPAGVIFFLRITSTSSLWLRKFFSSAVRSRLCSISSLGGTSKAASLQLQAWGSAVRSRPAGGGSR